MEGKFRQVKGCLDHNSHLVLVYEGPPSRLFRRSIPLHFHLKLIWSLLFALKHLFGYNSWQEMILAYQNY